MVEMLGMQSEGRAYHDQQLYDLGWGGIHRRHCFTRTIEPFNPQLKYRYSHFPGPTSTSQTDDPARQNARSCLNVPQRRAQIRHCFVALDHQSTLPRENEFRRLFEAGAERLVDAGLLFTAVALAGCFCPFPLLAAGAMGSLLDSTGLPGVGASPSLSASESAIDCAAA